MHTYIQYTYICTHIGRPVRLGQVLPQAAPQPLCENSRGCQDRRQSRLLSTYAHVYTVYIHMHTHIGRPVRLGQVLPQPQAAPQPLCENSRGCQDRRQSRLLSTYAHAYTVYIHMHTHIGRPVRLGQVLPQAAPQPLCKNSRECQDRCQRRLLSTYVHTRI